MALADRLPAKSSRPGIVDRILAGLPAEDAEVLQGWLDDPSVSAARIARALTDEGYPVGEWSIKMWRRDAR